MAVSSMTTPSSVRWNSSSSMRWDLSTLPLSLGVAGLMGNYRAPQAVYPRRVRESSSGAHPAAIREGIPRTDPAGRCTGGVSQLQSSGLSASRLVSRITWSLTYSGLPSNPGISPRLRASDSLCPRCSGAICAYLPPRRFDGSLRYCGSHMELSSTRSPTEDSVGAKRVPYAKDDANCSDRVFTLPSHYRKSVNVG